ncbi:MAG: hypothetical protein JXA77_17000 [Bacteroidales bacterium]|nr:hypothetical protein [Bacteroidales bacterium]MBN2819400.1 hypothetical protein [Bacteroidales bacterium]
MNRRGVKIVLLFIISFFICSDSLFGQRWKLKRYEVGLGVGTTQIFGDIGGSADESNWFGIKDIKFDETKLSYAGNIRYKINPYFTVKTNLIYGFGEGSDVGTRNDRGRGYHTKMFEASGIFEYYFLREDKGYRSAAMYNKRGMLNNYSSTAAYVFVGFGANMSNTVHADTMPIIGGYDLYKAKNTAPVIPFGIGIKYIIDESIYVNADFGYRVALNDYVEGYKTLASKYPDVYYFFTVSVNYRLKTSRRNIPAFLDFKYSKFGY